MGETAIEEDTVSADEEHDEIEADDGAERLHSAVRVDTVVHDVVPVLAGQYLQPTTDLLTTITVTVTNQCLRRPDRHRKSYLANRTQPSAYCFDDSNCPKSS